MIIDGLSGASGEFGRHNILGAWIIDDYLEEPQDKATRGQTLHGLGTNENRHDALFWPGTQRSDIVLEDLRNERVVSQVMERYLPKPIWGERPFFFVRYNQVLLSSEWLYTEKDFEEQEI